MRDKRFVAAHRGGPLSREEHCLLVSWAADCAERVLPLFESEHDDDRPRLAIAAARSWVKDEIATGLAQSTAYAAHAAARECGSLVPRPLRDQQDKLLPPPTLPTTPWQQPITLSKQLKPQTG